MTATPTNTPTPGYLTYLGVVGVSSQTATDPNNTGTLTVTITAHVDAGKSLILHFVTTAGTCNPMTFSAVQTRGGTAIGNPFGYDATYGLSGELRTVTLSSIGMPNSVEVNDIITITDCLTSNISRGAFATAWDGITGHTTAGAIPQTAGAWNSASLDGACATNYSPSLVSPRTGMIPATATNSLRRLTIGTYGMFTSLDSIGLCGGSTGPTNGVCPANTVLPQFSYPPPTPGGSGGLARAGTLTGTYTSNRQVDATYTIETNGAAIQLLNNIFNATTYANAVRDWTSVGCAYKEWPR